MLKIVYSFASLKDTQNIKKLLAQNQLPDEGINRDLKQFLVAKSNGRLVGSIGLEDYGHNGLLRSFAVASSSQGRGVGQELLNKMIAHAYLQNINQLYLLTMTAESFFAKRGFNKLPRGSVPRAVRNSVEFRSLCPKTASCMTMSLRKRAIYFPGEILRFKPNVPGARMWGVVALKKTFLTSFELKPRCKFSRHRHKSEQITLVLEGELFFDVLGRTVCLNKGEVIAIPSNIAHSVYTLNKGAKAIVAWSPVMEQYKR